MNKGDKFIRTAPAQYYTVIGKTEYEKLPPHVKPGYKNAVRESDGISIVDESGHFHLIKNIIKI